MAFSNKLVPPIVSASIATIVLTNFAIVIILRQTSTIFHGLFKAIWPMALTSTVAIILVMSLLYRSLLELIVELEKRESIAQHVAAHDSLTNLPNRILLEDRLQQARSRLRRDGDKFALIMLDLDRFKQVNDILGHAAGDMLLQQVSSRLKSLIRETDTIARIGGDEFAIVLLSLKNEADVRRLCGRIVKALNMPFNVGDREVRVGVSVGAIISRNSDLEPDELLRKADITLYRAKASGRNCYRLFSDQMDVAVQRRARIETKLRHALDTGTGLEIHYQPQLDTASQVIAIEALLRWTDAELGNLSPSEVVPLAEESGLIEALDEFAFRSACHTAMRWPEITVAVNFSPLQFRRKDLAARLSLIARQQGIQCDQIEIEITESLFIEHSDVCAAALSDLRASGFRIALDDFGTGYSSLSYLRRFKVDKIKLDRSFIASAHLNQSVSIIRAAVTLGHALGLTVVAEGIASAQQEKVAREAGCDAFQGYRYARAMSAKQLCRYMDQKERLRAADNAVLAA